MELLLQGSGLLQQLVFEQTVFALDNRQLLLQFFLRFLEVLRAVTRQRRLKHEARRCSKPFV